MPTLELGSFVFLNLMAFGFMFYGSQKRLPLSFGLNMLSMGLFFALGLLIIEFDIVSEVIPVGSELEYNSIGSLITNTTHPTMQTMIIDRNDFGLGYMWIYFGLGTISLILFFVNWAGHIKKLMGVR